MHTPRGKNRLAVCPCPIPDPNQLPKVMTISINFLKRCKPDPHRLWKISMILCGLVIHRPPVFLPKFIAGLFQCQIGSQIFLVEWFPRKRVRLGSFEMFHYGGPVVRTSRLSDDGVVHDRKGDVVDKIVRHLLHRNLACFLEELPVQRRLTRFSEY